MSEPLPQLYQQVVTLWKQRQAALGEKGLLIQHLIAVVDHILRGFEVLSQGRDSSEAVKLFRAEMKQASRLLPDTEPIVSVMTQLTLPDSRISKDSIQQVNTWMRQTLQQALAEMQSLSVLGQRQREIIEILDEEAEPKKKRPKVIVEDEEISNPDEEEISNPDEEEEEPEQLVDEELQALEEEGIALKLAPLIWQNSTTGMWQYALFTDSQNAVYDARGNFASQEAAKQDMEHVLDQADQAGSQAYRHLLQEAYVAWTQKNENQACRDVQGTERLSIEDSDGLVQNYIIVFTSVGPKQLSKLPEYKQLVVTDEKDPGYQAAWDKTFVEIQTRQTTWVNRILSVAQNIDKNVVLIQSRITKCNNIVGIAPILAMISMVLKAPSEASEEELQHLDETLFEAL